MKRTRHHALVYLTAAAIAVVIMMIPLAALLAFDVYLHHRVQNKIAVVITQPYRSDLHVDQQNALGALMAKRFASDRLAAVLLPLMSSRTAASQ
jgi:hypothetical protein